MSQQFDFLTDQDIRQINSLVETLDKSNFEYLQIDVGSIKVTIGKGQLPAASAAVGTVPAIAAPAPVIAPAVAVPAAAPVAAAATVAPAAGQTASAPQPGWLPVKASTMGRFYSRPDPNSAPYVKIGDRVSAEDTVCLIEVMKLFNAIPAGVSGTVVQVCVEDAAVVEFGQVLFYVQP
jgi:acetyl-CoA carboxylase biotin carboxyl carrier protein